MKQEILGEGAFFFYLLVGGPLLEIGKIPTAHFIRASNALFR
jgi:hypothetical protein